LIPEISRRRADPPRNSRASAGRAEFVYVAEHSLPNAHLALSDPKLWEQQADALLKDAETSKR